MDFTNHKGVEPAMEWLLAHSDDAEVAPETVASDSPATTAAAQSTSSSSNEAAAIDSNQVSTTDSETAPEAKSLKCDEWFVTKCLL